MIGPAPGTIDGVGVNPMCGPLEGRYRAEQTAQPVVPVPTILAGKLPGRGPMALPRDVYDLAIAVKRARGRREDRNRADTTPGTRDVPVEMGRHALEQDEPRRHELAQRLGAAMPGSARRERTERDDPGVGLVNDATVQEHDMFAGRIHAADQAAWERTSIIVTSGLPYDSIGDSSRWSSVASRRLANASSMTPPRVVLEKKQRGIKIPLP